MKNDKTRTFAKHWVVRIEDVVIPQSEYNWTEDNNFYFPKKIIELANEYCSIHKTYKTGDTVKVSMSMEWEVILDEK